MTTPDYSLGSVMPASQPPRRSRRPLVLVLAAAVVAALVAGGLYLFLPSDLTVHGEIRLTDDKLLTAAGDSCAGQGGYDDMHAGTQVVVTAPDGAVLAFGVLAAGALVNGSQPCVFKFTVNVPSGKDVYGFTTGRRGTVQVNEAALDELVVLDLGN